VACGQLETDLGDVAQTTPAGGFVDPELERHLDGRQQRQLLRLLWLVVFVVFVHAPMMRRGCDTGAADSDRRVVGVETHHPQADAAPLEHVDERLELAQHL
jgi:hypothetical protein